MRFVPHFLFALLLVAVQAVPVLAEDRGPAGLQLAQAAADQPAAGMVARGDALLALGDVSAARLFYEAAAAQGSGEAAAKLASTFDPLQLRSQGVIGLRGDPDRALRWYSQAVNRGYAPAVSRLESLEAYLRSQGVTPENKIASDTSPAPEAPPAAPAQSNGGQQAPAGGALGTQDGEARLLDVSERLDAGTDPVQPGLGIQDAIVQLAALGSREAAIDTGVELQVQHWDLLGDKKLTIERLELSQGRGTMFGVRIGPFANEASAEELCVKLKIAGQDCFVVR